MAKAKKSVETVIKDIAEELLSKVQLDSTVTVSKDEEDTYQVTVNTEESGLLIGFHGETLAAFQMLLGLFVYKEAGDWVRLVVEVGDYRAKRVEQLNAMAEGFANRAMATNQPVVLPYLSPSDRRIIHIALKDNPQVESYSEGEGEQRRLVVKPK